MPMINEQLAAEQLAIERKRQMNDAIKPTETTATVYGVEFVEPDDPDGRKPGTYVTVRVDDPEIRWSAGRVAVRYIPN